MSTKARVLVTTGNGRTGAAAIKELMRLGHPVRALVRKEDHRALRWRKLGVEIVVGNLCDWRDLQRALVDVQRAYHCPPFDSNHLHGSMLFALAAEEAGLEAVALMSGWNPHPTHPSILQREHWLANNIYRRMPSLNVIHINPGLFAFTYLLGLPAAKHFGMLALPFGNGLNAPPSNEDIGAVAAGALADHKRYQGRCLRPMGPTLVTPQDVAQILSGLLGRQVSYRNVSTEMFAKAARAQGFPLFQIAQVRHYAKELREGAFAQEPNDHVHEVCGRPSETFHTTAARYIADPSLIMPGLKLGTFWQALAFGARMAFTPVPHLDKWELTRDYPLIGDGELAHNSAVWRNAAEASQLVLQPGGA